MNVYDGLNLILILIGVYLLVLGIGMKKSGKVASALLAQEEMGKVKDEALLAFALTGPVLLLGVIMLFDGITGEIFSRVYPIGWYRFIQLGLFLLGWMYFMKKYQDAKAVFVAV